jgi:acetylornithine/N-succinyldiaminopimelate aminotransferase
VIEELTRPGFLQRVAEVGAYLTKRLESLSRQYELGEVRGRGLLLALDLKRDLGARVVDHAREKGLLLNAPRPDTLRFMPALTLTHEEVDQMIAILGGILAEVSNKSYTE